jgi:hypothetical protein
VKAYNEVGWSNFSEESNQDTLMVDTPTAPSEGPIRESSGSTLTDVRLRLPEITGFETGGLTIDSYSVEMSSDQVSWTVLCGVDSDYPLTYYTESGLVTGESWYFRYSVKNSVGWSDVSPVMFTEIGTEPD